MNRREAVRNVAFLMGGALSATTIGVFLEGCNPTSDEKHSGLFTADQTELITELADVIIPATKTPGAKAAGVGPWIAMMVKDCYPKDAQDAFVKGIKDLDDHAKKEFGSSFLKISVKEREELIGKLRDETVAAQKAEGEKAIKDKTPKEEIKPTPYFFAIARDLTLLGYFTSEIGATQAYEYLDIPGRYDGDVKMKPGQRVWAT
ncbi:gluconate 2-dehydrogenase subunit 3 family protein [Pedobacter sp. AW31-3R]|uniref:gluconate 2-dehydrogenase subunit 3 family protein n=1 Tax=Pedobacter sp. AW31-3R TaxID=3445781 RepID=UPI003F9FDA94